jgi:PAS domain S-box-containing protein
MQHDTQPYPSSFKAAVALAALRGDQPVDALAERFGVPASCVLAWRATLEQHAAAAFAPAAPGPTAPPGLGDNQELAWTIAENSTQGLAMMDQHGYCIYANRAWLAMTGYSKEELASKPLHYLVHHHHPDGTPYPKQDCPIDRALPENFDVRAHEDLFFRKDGSTFDVLCAASPVFKAGKPVATVIEIRDVTEQKKKEQARLDSERRALEAARLADEQQQRLNAFLDAAPVGISMADRNGKLLLTNRANRKLWGERLLMAEHTGEYAAWKGWWADGGAHHGQPVQAEEWALARSLRGEDVDNDVVEIEPFDSPGERKIIALSARPIRDAEGQVTGGIVAQVDITQQKRTEAALRQADRNKDDFIAMLAHELRNPLAPIRAAIDIFLMRQVEDPVLKRATGAMARQVDHITRLVDDLLDVARISRGRIELQCDECDIVHIVTHAAGDYLPGIEAKGVTLSIDAPAAPLWVRGDGARLTQIVANLMHNAFKFTERGNHIQVGVGFDADSAVITVDDNGAGMTPELLSSLFSPFVQGSQGLSRSTGGLGLGLALVKGLAEAHGGQVSAASSGPGLGATFTVRLPLVQPSDCGSVPHERGSGPAGLSIAAIDDNRDALDMLGILLGLNGHEVIPALDGAAGLDAVRRVRPDVVICDIGLPGALNGYDVARAIRADPALRGTPLIAMSGYGQASERANSSAAGFDLHLVKPVREEDLLAALETLLQDRQRQQRP